MPKNLIPEDQIIQNDPTPLKTNKKQGRAIILFISLLIIFIASLFFIFILLTRDPKVEQADTFNSNETQVNIETEQIHKQTEEKRKEIDQNIATSSVATSTLISTTSQTIVDISNWQEYRHDVIGLSFSYPPQWLSPKTEPSRAITDLESVNQGRDYTDKRQKTIGIYFESGPNPDIMIFNDQYPGHLYYGSHAPQYGTTDNPQELAASGNICDYRTKFSHPEVNGILEEIYSDCEEGVKVALVKDSRQYSEMKYTYSLSMFAYIRLMNGYYNHALIRQDVGFTGQLTDSDMDLDEFLEHESLGEEYPKQKEFFKKFVASLAAFAPSSEEVLEFTTLPDEDGDITTIRQFYFNIVSGDLEAAYAMYLSPSVSLDKFREWYQNTILAEPYNFQTLEEHKYQFYVKFQDHNQPATVYRVGMAVSAGKLTTQISEQITSEEAEYNDMTAFVAERNKENYVVLQKKGKEIIVDQAVYNFPDEMNSLGFGLPQFSPQGTYLTYIGHGWEWSIGRIYHISTEEIVLDYFDTQDFGFSPDEKYFFDCTGAGMTTGTGITVRQAPDFTVVFDKQIKESDGYPMSSDCEIKADGTALLFRLYNFPGEEGIGTDEDREENYEYIFATKELKRVD